MSGVHATWRNPGAVALAAAVLAGCAASGSGAADEPRKAPIPAPSATGEAACFYPRDVQDFRALDRRNLIVYAPNERNAYHVQISPPSMDLPWADSVAFLPTGGRICGYAGERLLVGGATAGHRVGIVAVSRLSPQSLEYLRGASSGTLTPAAKPEPGPGAEIEETEVPEQAPAPANEVDATGEM